jgi:hypothetical protein
MRKTRLTPRRKPMQQPGSTDLAFEVCGSSTMN